MGTQGAWLVSSVGLGAAGVGIVIGAPYVIAGGVAGAIISGVGAMLEDKRIEKQRAMFKDCDLSITKGESIIYPSIISSNDDYMLVDLPSGMAIGDISKKHGAIESYYGRKVIIEQTSNRKVLIKILSPGAKELDRWLDIFKGLGLIDSVGEYPRLIDSEINRIGQRVVFKLPYGMVVNDFEKKQEQLESALRCKVDISSEKYKLVIQSLTREFEKTYKADFRKILLPAMQFIIGVGRDGEPLAMDLGGNEFSTLVCGASGSGKSVFLNTLMVQFILKDIIIFAIDMKAVEFSTYRNYKHMEHYASNKKDAVKVLESAYDLMQSRYKELEQNDCTSYADYNKKSKGAMPPVLLIIDEYSVLMGDKKATFFLFELLSRARASNILVIICTQTPRAKVLDTTIRCNIKNTVCFSVETDSDSEVALGQKGNYKAARELNTEGRGFLKSKGKLIEFQGYFITRREAEEQIANKTSYKAIKKDNLEESTTDKVIPLKKANKGQIDNVIKAIDNL